MANRRRLWIWFLVIFGGVLSTGGVVGANQLNPGAPTLVNFHPATANLAAGDTLLVELWVENVTALYGADIQLHFDPTAWRVLDADPNLAGVQIRLRSDLLKPGFVIHREADNQTGMIWYANSQVNPASPVSGSGALFEFSLLALKNGDFPVTITAQQLSDQSGSPIPAVSQDALFTVKGYKTHLALIRR